MSDKTKPIEAPEGTKWDVAGLSDEDMDIYDEPAFYLVLAYPGGLVSRIIENPRSVHRVSKSIVREYNRRTKVDREKRAAIRNILS